MVSARRRAPHLALAFALAVAWATPAAAQVPDKAMAEKFFLEGRDLMKAGQTALACDRFERSQVIEPRLGTKLNVATCHEELGKTASAWGEFVEAADEARAAKDDKREAFAREHATALESKLSRVEITRAGDPPGFKLKIDNKPLSDAFIGTVLPMDPGKHAVEATAPGRRTWATDFVVPPGPSRTPLKIPVLEPESSQVVAPPPVIAPVVVAPPPPPPPRREPESHGWPPAAYVAFTVGAVGLVVGSITGGVSIAQEGAISDCHAGTCPPGDAGKIESANRTANISNVSFGVAGAGALTGLIIVLASGPSKPAQAQAAGFHPTAQGFALKF